MGKTKYTKLYNVLFPIWMLVWMPFSWFVVVPLNYLIDRFVLGKSLDISEKEDFLKKNTWKICLAGFLADFCGTTLLFILIASDRLREVVGSELINQITYNPFLSIPAFLSVLAVIIAAASVIYILDSVILKRCGLDQKQAHHSALYMAVFTSPYLLLIPSSFLY